MNTIIRERFAIHPNDFRKYDTEMIRNEFLVDGILIDNKISMVYSQFDRFIVGGVVPKDKTLQLESVNALKTDYFLARREMGIINIGGKARITADDKVFELEYKEALYLGKGIKKVIFESLDKKKVARLYFNSASAHKEYPARMISKKDAEVIELGSLEHSNHRKINKLIVNSKVETCQLQMGMTELKAGSVWNTMPPHTHNRRMETYFYFEVPDGQVICHFMGHPQETRHIWMQNEQAVLSPSWSIHSAAGTSNYAFIWGMAGENLDFNDMDGCAPTDLK